MPLNIGLFKTFPSSGFFLPADHKGTIIPWTYLDQESFAKEHIKIPINQLGVKAEQFLRKDDFIVVYGANLQCQASPTAAAILKTKSFPFVFDYTADLKDYKEAGMPSEEDTQRKVP